jgi:hypothetical protein
MTATSPASVDAPARPTPFRRPRRGLALAAILAVAAFLVLSAGAAALTLLSMRADLQRGERAAREARRAVLAGRLDRAEQEAGAAEAAFAAAAARGDGALARVGTWLPFLGNNVDVAVAIAHAGAAAAEAAEELARAVEALPGGLAALAPRDGRLPLEAAARLAGPVAAAADRVEEGGRRVAEAPAAFLLGELSEARWGAEHEMGELARTLRGAERLLAALPRFAGADGVRRYLVTPENPAELRGTGGLWGAYTVLELRDGRPRFAPVRPIRTLPPTDPEEIPAPSPDYRRLYDQYGALRDWRNINMTPDLPSAARAALGAYASATGERLDGVLTADPFALEAMMRVTGPIRVPGTDLRLAAGRVVRFVTAEAYTKAWTDAEHKGLLGDLAIEVVRRFLQGDGDPDAHLRVLAAVVADGHLGIYSTDPTFQEGLSLTGADGAYAAPAGSDVVAVTVNNGSGNKVDTFTRRSVAYEVRLGGRGEAIGTTRVRLDNQAPARGPRELLGPFVGGLEAGDLRPITTIACPDPCTFVDGTVDGAPGRFAWERELGIPRLRDFGVLPAGSSRTIEVVTTTSGVWTGNASAGRYRLTVLGQTTVLPTELTITVRAPDGCQITWTSAPMTVEGGVATWRGAMPDRMELEVRFSAPVPLRWGRNLLRPLGGL